MSQVAYHWWWRPGWRAGRRFYTVHATFADIPAVQDLAAKARNRLTGVAGLDLIPRQWLHLTMQGIGFTDEVSDADLSAITTAAKTRLAVVPPATVAIGPPVVAGEGVTCWASPPSALDPARDAVRSGIADVWGPHRVPDAAEWAAHVSVAYASADGPGEPIEAALGGLADVAETTHRGSRPDQAQQGPPPLRVGDDHEAATQRHGRQLTGQFMKPLGLTPTTCPQKGLPSIATAQEAMVAPRRGDADHFATQIGVPR